MSAKLSLYFGIFLFTTISVHGQQSAVSSGGDATEVTGSISYSVGQVFYTSVADESASVTQGIQQPYLISEQTGKRDIGEIALSYLIYPNPTTDRLVLNFGDIEFAGYVFQLYDINGRVLLSNKIESNVTDIDMSLYSPDIYILNVSVDGEIVRVFKIIKN